MIDIQSAVLAAVATVVFLYVCYRIWRWHSSVDEVDDQETTREELKSEAEYRTSRDRISRRDRIRAQPVTTKVFYGSILAFAAVFAVAAYQFAKTGSPQEMAYASQIEYAIQAIILVGAGVVAKNRLDAKGGEINVTYEREAENTSETFYYDPSMTEIVSDDNNDDDVGPDEVLLVPIYKSRRIFGLFWRPKMVADSERARDVDKNFPGDRVIVEIPLDGSSVWDRAEQTINLRAKKKDSVTDPNRTATFEFVPSERESKSTVQSVREENEQLKQEVKSERKMNAGLTAKLFQFEEAIEELRHDSTAHLEEALEVFEDVSEAVSNPGRRRTNGHSGQQTAEADDEASK